MRIIHADGVWLRNLCAHPMADPTQNARLNPGEPTCVRMSDWLRNQMACGLFEKVASPLEPAKPVEKPQPPKQISKPAA